jgi:thiol-disulfide isomerase/thioredoxin
MFRQNHGQFTVLEPRQKVPEFSLTRLQGGQVASSRYQGKTVLLNFWATWCPPCRWQLPTLERLAQNRDRRKLEVLAVSVDKEGGSAVKPYLKRLGIKDLEVFVDPHEAVAYSDIKKYGQVPFALYGMPISYLIDRQGVVIGYFPGAADWTSEAGQRLLEYIM